MILTDKNHSDFGASGAHRWMHCTGSVSLSSTLCTVPQSDAAREGTEAHYWVLEEELKSFLENRQKGTPFVPLFKHPKKAEIKEEIVEWAAEFRTLIWEKILDERITGVWYGIEHELFLSTKLDMFGTADFVSISRDLKAKRKGAVVDFKSGHYEVAIKNNEQLIFYACALLKWVREHGKDLDYVETAIYQPKSDIPWKTKSYTARQLESWERKLFRPVENVLVKNKVTFKVGDWCRFCPAKAICTKFSDSLEVEVNLERAIKTTLPSVNSVSPDVITKILTHGDVLVDYVKSIKAYVMNEIKEGRGFPGYKIVQGPTKRCWKPETELIAEDLIRLGVEDPYKKTLKPLSQIEKQLKKGEIDVFLTQTKPKPILVPESDPRKSAENLLDLFSEDED